MHRLIPTFVLVASCTLIPSLASAQSPARTDSIAELPTPAAYQFTSAGGLGSTGLVAGMLWSQQASEAAVWDGRQWRQLGQGEAHDVATSGNVVGFAEVGDVPHATQWNAQGVAQGLGSLTLGGWSDAQAVNDRDWVAGFGQTSAGVTHAFLWQPSSGMRDLGALGAGNSYAFAISRRGEVAGASDGAAVVWDRHQQIHDLGAGSGSRANGINDAGTVVGDANQFAFTWTERDGVKRLGTAPGVSSSTAKAINHHNLIVGTATLATGSGPAAHAVIWRAGNMIDLNSQIDTASGWELTSATDINDRNQVTGTGLHNGQPGTFVLSLRD